MYDECLGQGAARQGTPWSRSCRGQPAPQGSTAGRKRFTCAAGRQGDLPASAGAMRLPPVTPWLRGCGATAGDFPAAPSATTVTPTPTHQLEEEVVAIKEVGQSVAVDHLAEGGGLGQPPAQALEPFEGAGHLELRGASGAGRGAAVQAGHSKRSKVGLVPRWARGGKPRRHIGHAPSCPRGSRDSQPPGPHRLAWRGRLDRTPRPRTPWCPAGSVWRR